MYRRQVRQSETEARRKEPVALKQRPQISFGFNPGSTPAEVPPFLCSVELCLTTGPPLPLNIGYGVPSSFEASSEGVQAFSDFADRCGSD